MTATPISGLPENRQHVIRALEKHCRQRAQSFCRVAAKQRRPLSTPEVNAEWLAEAAKNEQRAHRWAGWSDALATFVAGTGPLQRRVLESLQWHCAHQAELARRRQLRRGPAKRKPLCDFDVAAKVLRDILEHQALT